MSETEISHRAGVSICIPNWNHKSFLPRSIASAKDTARDLRDRGILCEILIVDDASRDSSQRAVAAIALMDEHDLVDIILQPQNKGLAAARNLALDHARYQYVCFLDADNELIAPNFHLFVEAIEKVRAAVVFGNLVAHDGRTAVSLLSNFYVQERLCVANYIDALALYDKKKLVAAGGFNEKLTSHEDWELFLHLLAEGEELVFVPICMGYYYIVSNSMVQTESFDHKRMWRMFGQRESLKIPKRKMFHPKLGWI